MHAWRQGRAIPDARRHTTQIHPKFALNSVLTSSPLASPPPPLTSVLTAELQGLAAQGVRLRFVGDIAGLPPSLQVSGPSLQP